MTCRKREVKNQKLEIRILNAHIPLPTWHFETKKIEFGPEKWKMGFKRGFSWLKCGPQFALGGWSWTVLSYRVQRKVITSDLERSYLLPTRAKIKCQYKRGLTLSTIITANIQCCFMQSLWQTFDNFYTLSTSLIPNSLANNLQTKFGQTHGIFQA